MSDQVHHAKQTAVHQSCQDAEQKTVLHGNRNCCWPGNSIAVKQARLHLYTKALDAKSGKPQPSGCATASLALSCMVELLLAKAAAVDCCPAAVLLQTAFDASIVNWQAETPLVYTTVQSQTCLQVPRGW